MNLLATTQLIFSDWTKLGVSIVGGIAVIGNTIYKIIVLNRIEKLSTIYPGLWRTVGTIKRADSKHGICFSNSDYSKCPLSAISDYIPVGNRRWRNLGRHDRRIKRPFQSVITCNCWARDARGGWVICLLGSPRDYEWIWPTFVRQRFWPYWLRFISLDFTSMLLTLLTFM